MTIDDSIRYIKGLRDAGGCGYQQANIAISTMRKYQKIQELMIGWNNFNSYERMCEIYEVIEDGKS